MKAILYSTKIDKKSKWYIEFPKRHSRESSSCAPAFIEDVQVCGSQVKEGMRIILASQSLARRRLLKKLGYRFTTVPSQVDEAKFKKKLSDPRALVRILAKEKARAIQALYPESLIIGSDQTLVCGKKIFDKPGSAENAIKQLSKLSGQTAELLTAVEVRTPKGRYSFLDVCRIEFRHLRRDEIVQYVLRDKPFECAGSFRFEGTAVTLFAKLSTKDPSAIEGLPLIRLGAVLRKIHFAK